MKVRAFFVIKGKSRLCHCEVAARACTPKWLSIEKTFLPGRRFGTQAWQSQEIPRFARDKDCFVLLAMTISKLGFGFVTPQFRGFLSPFGKGG